MNENLRFQASVIATGRFEGREEGLAEGRAEGMAQERMNNAKALLMQGISLDIIVNALYLSDDEVANIKKTL